MRRHDKTVAMLKANMLFEQRCNKILNEELDNLDEGLKDAVKKAINVAKNKFAKYIPKVKDGSDAALEKSKEVVSKALGFAKDQWNDKENQDKVKEKLEAVKKVANGIKDASIDTLQDKNKRKALASTLGMAAIVSLVKGVWDVIIGSDIGLDFWNGELGSFFFVKLSLFMYALKILVKILGGVMNMKEVLGNIKSYITNMISIFTGKSSENNNNPVNEAKLNEYFDLVFGNDNYKLI